MIIKAFKPQNSQLSSYIDCFYIIDHQETSTENSFLILPSFYTYLSVSLATETTVKTNKIIEVKQTYKNNLDSSLQIGLKTSHIFEYKGLVKELCIKFKPLGIYNFFKEEKIHSSEENQTFFLNIESETIITSILRSSSYSEIIEKTEDYLISRLKHFQHPYLNKILKDLETMETGNLTTLEDLAKSVGVSRPTLNAQFKKYLHLTPSEYKQIWRLRMYIDSKLISKNTTSSNDMLFDLGFFDQSHMIKEFKKYTLLKPKEFFKQIDYSKDSKVLLIWQ
jgi:AraC-like DNA-binding protein